MMATAAGGVAAHARFVVLAHGSASVEAAVGAVRRAPEEQRRWLLLTSDLAVRRRWEVGLIEGFEALPLQPHLDRAAQELREPFLAMLDAFGDSEPAGSDWWLSRLAEGNTLVDPTFLYACYVRASREHVSGARPPDLVVADSWALLETVRRLCEEHGCETLTLGFRGRSMLSVREKARSAASAVRFLGRSAFRHVVARRTPDRQRDRGPEDMVLVSTFLHEEDISADGAFRDRYLPHLHEWLRSTGHAVRVLGIPARPPLPTRCMREMRKSDTEFIVPEDWLRPSDYVEAFLTGWRLRAPTGPIVVLGMDLRPIVEEVARAHSSSDAARQAVLLRRLPHRLAQGGLTPTAVIIWAENQLSDRALIAGCRAAFAGSALTAVQNTPLFSNLLNLFRTRAQCVAGLAGDRIVCSGPLPARILSDASGGHVPTVVACGLRYDYPGRSLSDPATRAVNSALKVLFALPITMSEGGALLSIASGVFRERPQFEVFIRPHPDYSLEELQRLFGSAFPCELQVATGGLPDWLARVDVVVTSGSGTALEAVAAGREVVLVGGQAIFTLDPLEWFDWEQPPAYDLQEVLRRLDSVSRGQLVSARVSDEVRRQWFCPVTAERLSLFLT